MTQDEHNTLNAQADAQAPLSETEVNELYDLYGRTKPRYIAIHESNCSKIVENKTIWQELKRDGVFMTYYATICNPEYKHALYKVQDNHTLLLIASGESDEQA